RVDVAEGEGDVLLILLATRRLLGLGRPLRSGRRSDRLLGRRPVLGGRRRSRLGLGLLGGLGGLLGLRAGVLRDLFLGFLCVSHDSPRALAPGSSLLAGRSLLLAGDGLARALARARVR